MSIWEVVGALVPTRVILPAGIAVIEHLRVKGEGARYQHREYRVDEELGHDNGKSSNGRRRRPNTERVQIRWKDWLP